MTDFQPSVTAAIAKDKLRNRHSKDLAMPHSSPATEALSLLKDYEQWEADIILENKCWTGQNIQLTDELYERMIDLQTKRNQVFIRASQPFTPERKAWLVKWKNKDTTTYYDEPPPPTASMESVTPIHTADQCSAGTGGGDRRAGLGRRTAAERAAIAASCEAEAAILSAGIGSDAVAGEAEALAAKIEAAPLFRGARDLLLYKNEVDLIVTALRSPDAAATPREADAWELVERDGTFALTKDPDIARIWREAGDKVRPLYADAAQGSVSAEDIARTICLSYGRDADELTSIGEMCDADNRPVPIWMVYEEQADAILAAYSISSTTRGGAAK